MYENVLPHNLLAALCEIPSGMFLKLVFTVIVLILLNFLFIMDVNMSLKPMVAL